MAKHSQAMLNEKSLLRNHSFIALNKSPVTMNCLILYILCASLGAILLASICAFILYAHYLGPRFIWVFPGRHLVLEYQYFRDQPYTIEGRVLVTLPYCLYLVNRNWHCLRLDVTQIKAIAFWSWRKGSYQPYQDYKRSILPSVLVPQSIPIPVPEVAHLSSM